MKSLIKNILPEKLKIFIKILLSLPGIFSNYLYDLVRFIKYSSMFKRKNNRKYLTTHIMLLTHSIERALALKNVRLGFGKARIVLLIDLLKRYEKAGFDIFNNVFILGVTVLDSYLSFHDKNNFKIDINAEDILYLRNLLPQNIKKRGGTIEFTKQNLLKNSKSDFHTLASSRFSVRDFSGDEVDINLIIEAVKIAQKAPSVCNRQPVRIYIVKDKDDIENIINNLSGVRGFENSIGKLVIVTSDLSRFVNLGERNQCYIDGGIFLMSLLFALQFKGLAACTLNWSVEMNRDMILRKIAGIERDENIVALVAVGHLADKFTVPVSNRVDTQEILTIV